MNALETVRRVTITEAIEDMRALLMCGVAVMLLGAPGSAKSDAVRLVASLDSYAMIDTRASQYDAVDVRGIPYADLVTKTTHWLTPDVFPNVARDGPRGIWFLDELTNAPIAVQAALYQLILDRRLGEYVLPDGWVIVAAGNTQSDRAAANRLASALANRFAIMSIRVDVPSWLAWAQTIGNVHPAMCAFIGGIGAEMLHRMPEPGSDDPAFPTPRSVTRFAKLIPLGMPVDQLRRMAAYNCGTAFADAFIPFYEVWKGMPDMDALIADPTGFPLFTGNPSLASALAVGLAGKMTHDNVDAINAYAMRMPGEYRAIVWKVATGKDPSLAETKAHVAHLIKNAQE